MSGTLITQVSDGGSAILLASEDGLKKAGIPLSDCIEVIGAQYGCGNLYEDAADLSQVSPRVTDVSDVVCEGGNPI